MDINKKRTKHDKELVPGFKLGLQERLEREIQKYHIFLTPFEISEVLGEMKSTYEDEWIELLRKSRNG